MRDLVERTKNHYFVRLRSNSKIYFHGNDLAKFHQFISIDKLPADFGGNLPAIDYTGLDWYPCVAAQIDHIEKYQRCGFVDGKEG